MRKSILFFLFITTLLTTSLTLFAKSNTLDIEEPGEMLRGQKYVLFSRDTCEYCQVFEKALNQTLLDNPKIVVYRFDTDKFRGYQEFEKILELYSIRGVPDLIHVENGKVLSRFQSQEKKKEDIENDLFNYFQKERIFDKNREMMNQGYVMLCVFSLLFFIQMLVIFFSDKVFKNKLYMKIMISLASIATIKIVIILMYHETFVLETYGLNFPKQNFFYMGIVIVLNLATLVMALIRKKQIKEE